MAKAIGMVEFVSIARGIYAADQMVKVSEVEIATATPTCPGKYIVVVYGDVAAVEASVEAGKKSAGEFYVDHILIPNVHPDVFPAIIATTTPEHINAVGIVESFSMATMVEVADAILKAAELEAIELRLGNGLGGKAFFVFTGDVASVEAGAAAGEARAQGSGLLVNIEVIPSPSPLLIPSLM